MNTNRKEKIIAIIPALNEEGKIGKVISHIRQEASMWIDEILVIDDGSKDHTYSEAKSQGATVISHPYTRGVGAAIRTAVEYALKNKYDVSVVLAGDNQDSPWQISRLLYPILYDSFDFVQGSRYMAGGEQINMPLYRRITTGIYSLLFRIMARAPISDGTNGFRAFRLDIFTNKNINIWQSWLDRYELEPYLFYKVIECNFKVTEAPVTKSYNPREIGYTKMIPILDWWGILRPILLLRLRIKR